MERRYVSGWLPALATVAASAHGNGDPCPLSRRRGVSYNPCASGPAIPETFALAQVTPARLRYRSLWLLLGWLLVLFIVYESLTPHPVELQVEQGDKLGHVAAYLALMS